MDWPLDSGAETAPPRPGPRPRSQAFDRGTFELAERVDTDAAYRAYLDSCAEHDCAHRKQAQHRLEVLEAAVPAADRAVSLQPQLDDLDAYSRAVGVNTAAAYRRYLDQCAEWGCRYRMQAEQRLDALQTTAEQAAQQLALVGQGAEQAKRADQLDRLKTTLDQAAFGYAQEADSERAYRDYLESCAVVGCGHREQAKARLAESIGKEQGLPFEPELVMLEAGCFEMGGGAATRRRDPARGSRPRGGPSEYRGRDERAHQVCVDAFQIAKHEVTFAQYDAFAQATGRPLPDDAGWGRGQRPVINVSWEDATAYAAWLAAETGEPYRLPTEAEWEYAARAGTQSARYWGDEADAACLYGNVHDRSSERANGLSWSPHACDDGYPRTAPVGQFKPNAWGLYDMLGNVWEWTCSAYDGAYEGGERQCAAGGNFGSRAIRGGAWHSQPRVLRSASRRGILPSQRYGGLGFRVAQEGRGVDR
jgi:formylglycine-generating enzyme required for sulfatase activity